MSKRTKPLATSCLTANRSCNGFCCCCCCFCSCCSVRLCCPSPALSPKWPHFISVLRCFCVFSLPSNNFYSHLNLHTHTYTHTHAQRETLRKTLCRVKRIANLARFVRLSLSLSASPWLRPLVTAHIKSLFQC